LGIPKLGAALFIGQLFIYFTGKIAIALTEQNVIGFQVH
jgi:hypothetical protein